MSDFKCSRFVLVSAFVLKMSSAFYVCYIFQVNFRLDFIMESNTMHPGQTAPLVADDKKRY